MIDGIMKGENMEKFKLQIEPQHGFIILDKDDLPYRFILTFNQKAFFQFNGRKEDLLHLGFTQIGKMEQLSIEMIIDFVEVGYYQGKLNILGIDIDELIVNHYRYNAKPAFLLNYDLFDEIRILPNEETIEVEINKEKLLKEVKKHNETYQHF